MSLVEKPLVAGVEEISRGKKTLSMKKPRIMVIGKGVLKTIWEFPLDRLSQNTQNSPR